MNIDYTVPPCPHCDGSGALIAETWYDETVDCTECDGSGEDNSKDLAAENAYDEKKDSIVH